MSHFDKCIKECNKLPPGLRMDLIDSLKFYVRKDFYDIFSDYLILKNFEWADPTNGLDTSEIHFYFEESPLLTDVTDDVKLSWLNSLGCTWVYFHQANQPTENYFMNHDGSAWTKHGGYIELKDGSTTGNPIYFGKIK